MTHDMCIYIYIDTYIYIYIYIYTSCRRRRWRRLRRHWEKERAARAPGLLVVCWGWPLGPLLASQHSDSEFSGRRLTLVCRCWVSPRKTTGARQGLE